LLNNWHNSTLAMSMIGWKHWKRTFRTNSRGEWQGCCGGCLWAKDLAWIQFMLDWITILSLGALLGPFVFFLVQCCWSRPHELGKHGLSTLCLPNLHIILLTRSNKEKVSLKYL
jgi:hypothetical protein